MRTGCESWVVQPGEEEALICDFYKATFQYLKWGGVIRNIGTIFLIGSVVIGYDNGFMLKKSFKLKSRFKLNVTSFKLKEHGFQLDIRK